MEIKYTTDRKGRDVEMNARDTKLHAEIDWRRRNALGHVLIRAEAYLWMLHPLRSTHSRLSTQNPAHWGSHQRG